MAFVFRRYYMKAKNNVIFSGNQPITFHTNPPNVRWFSDGVENNTTYSSGTMLVENCLNFQELPVVIKKIKSVAELESDKTEDHMKLSPDANNYKMIRAEFQNCLALRDIFSLLSKCTKITPNIALGAMERIYDLEKSPNPLETGSRQFQLNVAKGAIVDKLLQVVMKTEDTQTIINAINASSTFMEPYKESFVDELLLRTTDNKLLLTQLCEFMQFLINHKSNPKYSNIIDKLWVGFIERESEINEFTISKVYSFLPSFKESRRIMLTLVEQRLKDLWCIIKSQELFVILDTYIELNQSSPQIFEYAGRWLYTNIHNVDDDTLLEIITKFNKLSYTDQQIEKAIEKYLKLKCEKINSPILIVGILNHCTQFLIRNDVILKLCSAYIYDNSQCIPYNFLKLIICPFGYLNYDPGTEFWRMVENLTINYFNKISVNDICSIVLSALYIERHPMELINTLFKFLNMNNRIKDEEIERQLHLIDTSLCLQCEGYNGPLLPKNNWSNSISQDGRIRHLINKINHILVKIAGGPEKVSTSFSIPHLYSDESNLVDIMFHPVGWKLKSAKNDNKAVLIHLPEHYCSDGTLIGPQNMRKRHLEILGMKIVSLKYETLCSYLPGTLELEKYLIDNIHI